MPFGDESSLIIHACEMVILLRLMSVTSPYNVAVYAETIGLCSYVCSCTSILAHVMNERLHYNMMMQIVSNAV